jgi:hypothetical protein
MQYIDLSGPQGNAYFILGTAQKISNNLGLDTEKILDEMKSGDYGNLLKVFNNYFGEYVEFDDSGLNTTWDTL